MCLIKFHHDLEDDGITRLFVRMVLLCLVSVAAYTLYNTAVGIERTSSTTDVGPDSPQSLSFTGRSGTSDVSVTVTTAVVTTATTMNTTSPTITKSLGKKTNQK